MDGVLVDTEPIYIDITHRYLSGLGADIPKAELYSSVGIPTEITLIRLKSEYRLTESVAQLTAEEARARNRRFFEMKSYPIIDGVVELLDELKEAGFPCAIASSSSHEMISLILSRTGLAKYFDELVSGDDVPNGKPAPDIFLKAADSLSVAPSACTVIEDSPHGVKGANSAGMKTVGFQNPNSGNQDLSAADLIVDNFSPENRLLILELSRR